MEDYTYYNCDEQSPLITGEGYKSAHTRVYTDKLLISMVGLPARGKTHFSRKLTRYLTWMGYNAKVFNVGDKRRKLLGVQDTAKADFFDPNNKEAVKQREMLAEETLTDVVKFLNNKAGNIAIFDGTNTNAKRRKKIKYVLDTYLPDTHFFFLELICTDSEQIDRNVIKTKVYSPDYIGWNEEDIVKDFKERIHKYESVYEEVSVEADGDDIPFIKSINCNDQVIVKNIEGYLNLKIMTFLLNLHLEDRPLYLMRHGQSQFNAVGRIGGDPSLTDTGRAFGKLLNKFFSDEKERFGFERYTVHTSTLKRSKETAEQLDKESGLFDIKKPIKLLDEINSGICSGLKYDEIEEKFPEVAQGRKDDKMGYRYPRGESYYDVINRVEPYIVELESTKSPIIVISHNATLRCLYGYFAVLKINMISNIEIPLNTIIKITPQTYGYQEERFVFDTEQGTYCKVSLGDEDIKFIKKSKQRLSFDIDDLNSSKSSKLGSEGYARKIYSYNDLSSMTKSDKVTKLKRSKFLPK